jgi:hypothetical protein
VIRPIDTRLHGSLLYYPALHNFDTLLHKYFRPCTELWVHVDLFYNMTESTTNAQGEAEAITPYSMHVCIAMVSPVFVLSWI